MRNQDVRNYRAKQNLSDEQKLQIVGSSVGSFGELTLTSLRKAIEIVQGLQYLHSRELLHGDVKPSNILIDDGGHVQLGDFTLLRALAMDDHGPLNSQSSCDLASLRYQPPEVMKAEKVTPAADVYSWAMSFLVIASGGKCISPLLTCSKSLIFPKYNHSPSIREFLSC